MNPRASITSIFVGWSLVSLVFAALLHGHPDALAEAVIPVYIGSAAISAVGAWISWALLGVLDSSGKSVLRG